MSFAVSVSGLYWSDWGKDFAILYYLWLLIILQPLSLCRSLHLGSCSLSESVEVWRKLGFICGCLSFHLFRFHFFFFFLPSSVTVCRCWPRWRLLRLYSTFWWVNMINFEAWTLPFFTVGLCSVMYSATTCRAFFFFFFFFCEREIASSVA